MTGILLERLLSIPVLYLWITLATSCVIVLTSGFLHLSLQYRLSLLRGIALNIVVAACGALMSYYLDPVHKPNAPGKIYQPDAHILLVIQEPLSEKTASYKTTAKVEWLFRDNNAKKCDGTILVYFEKSSANATITYGDIIVTKASLALVSNTGNPAAFDYRSYCYLQGIHFQVYLRKQDYVLTNNKSKQAFKAFIFDLRRTIVAILDRHISSAKEAGLAEALLIGYKDNLDRDLIQSYSNTGVVHVIAISGLHLGLIYAILVLFVKYVKNKWLRLLIILTGIWLFTLLAGASPSVVRSAVMFTCIAFGNALSRRASVYNSLAASCFLLLSYDPFWLWDTGFQLSYAAVLSIIIFQKPVYQLINVSNKLLDMLWKTCAVTLAAQILTTPVCMYYFHQFPNLFLAANLVAIPLSSLILILEILLCCLTFCPPVANTIGNVTSWLIRLMNNYVELIDGHAFASWGSLQISTIQVVLVYVMISGIAYWLFETKKTALVTAVCATFLFFIFRTISFFDCTFQHRLIVYNIPRTSAIEFINGRHSWFIADTALINNPSLMQFHIRPARILYRIANIAPLSLPRNKTLLYTKASKTILITGSHVLLNKRPDLLILTGNPTGSITTIVQGDLPGMIVFDSSHPQWKVKKWMTECETLGIPAFSVHDQGAFVMNLN